MELPHDMKRIDLVDDPNLRATPLLIRLKIDTIAVTVSVKCCRNQNLTMQPVLIPLDTRSPDAD
jgi:hypothetical protein